MATFQELCYHYLLSVESNSRIAVIMASALMDLKRYLLKQNMIIRELKPENLVWCRAGECHGRFILVDGIGNNQFISVATYLKRFGRRVINRKWAAFERDLRELYSGSSFAGTMLLYL